MMVYFVGATMVLHLAVHRVERVVAARAGRAAGDDEVILRGRLYSKARSRPQGVRG